MIRKGIMALTLVFIVMVGTALALPEIVIKPDSGLNVNPITGVINVPVGIDAATSVGLAVEYSDFTAGNPFNQGLTTSANILVPGTASTGALTTGVDSEQIHWTPTLADIGKTFYVYGEGSTATGTRLRIVHVTAQVVPTPEMSTGVLMSAGLIGLVGITRYRRKE